MKKCLSFAVSLLLTLSLWAGALPAAALATGDEAIAFTDAALEAKVRASMGKPEGPIAMAEAGEIDYLNLNNETKEGLDSSQLIRDISDLRYFVNLSKLDIINNDVRDISVLSGLQGLKYLDLGGNAITDLTPLSVMALEELNIWGNGLSDLAPLAGIATLRRLAVNDNQISDFSPLSGLANLEALSVRMNASADYRALAGIAPQLKEKDFEVLTTPYDPNEVVAFEDKALETHVRAFLGLGNEPITAGYAGTVTVLDISNAWGGDVPEGERFRDISPLKYFVNLKELYLTRNAVQDISALAGLQSLTFLQMSDNDVLDFAPLAGLTELTYLALDSRGRDLSVLSGLAELTELDIGSGNKTLPPWLPGLTKLTSFGAAGGELTDISLLAQCKQLTSVNFGWNLISDISPLKELPLEYVYLNSNQISDISPLAGKALKRLLLAENPIADYTPIRDIYEKLAEKDFEYVELKQPDDPAKTISFADPVLEQKIRVVLGKPEGAITAADVAQVTRLDIHNDWQPQIPKEVLVSSLQGVEAFLNLRELDAGFNDIGDISPLSGLTELRKINLGANRINDITPLTGLGMLEDLTLFGNSISDISPLGGHTALRSLHLGNNPLAGVDVLAGLTSLDTLYMSGCGIEDISPLVGNANMTRLELNDNFIVDLTPLAGMTNLIMLKLANNPIEDYAPIEQIYPRLQEKDFEMGQVFDVQVPLKPEQPDQVVPMADAALEGIFRRFTGVQDRPLTEKDLSTIGKFEIKGENGQTVSDISALRYCLNLEGMVIWESNISDLSPLSGLTRLRLLVVNHSPVSDISPLQSLTQLETLDVAWNQITDFSPLYGLQGLKVLRISHNLTSDASGFKDIAKGLKEKDFDPDQPMETAQKEGEGEQTDGSSQAGLLAPEDPDKAVKFADKVLEQRVREAIGKPEGTITAGDAAQVTELYIGNEWQEKFPKGSQFAKLGGIEFFINLRVLDISFHKVKDLGKLSGLTQLTYLKAFGNVIQDVSPLAGLTSLTSLNVGGNKIKSVKPLSALQNLTVLMLDMNPIKDFSPVAEIYSRLTEKDFELK